MKLLPASLLAIFTLAMLEFSGFCFGKMRWLSTQEKIDIAVQYVLRRGDFSPQYWDVDRTLKTKEPRPISYASVAEFRKANPGCCEVVDLGPDGFSPSIIDRLTGHAACMVRVRYSVQYIDKTGALSRSELKELYPVIKNCGIAWPGI